MGKEIGNIDSFLATRLRDGMMVAYGGFGVCGVPEYGLRALAGCTVRQLTLVGNNPGIDDYGADWVIAAGRVDLLICSYLGGNTAVAEQVRQGRLRVDYVPQGTLAEKLRAGGAGIPAFYTPTGRYTDEMAGTETRLFDGQPCLLETALRPDIGLVRAWRGDALGNLVFRKTARNFNPLVAMAARVTLAEVEELVPVGALDGDAIHLPGVFIQAICAPGPYTPRFEQRRTRSGAA